MLNHDYTGRHNEVSGLHLKMLTDTGVLYWSLKYHKWHCHSDVEMEQDPMVLPTMSSACLLSVEKLLLKNKFNQRVRKFRNKGKQPKTK